MSRDSRGSSVFVASDVGDEDTGYAAIRKKGSSVIGNLTTAQIMIEDGADFKGTIEIDRSAKKETTTSVSSRAASAGAGAGLRISTSCSNSGGNTTRDPFDLRCCGRRRRHLHHTAIEQDRFTHGKTRCPRRANDRPAQRRRIQGSGLRLREGPAAHSPRRRAACGSQPPATLKHR